MLGLSKSFVIFLFLSIVVAIGSKQWKYGAALLGVYFIVKIIWNFLTK